MPEVRATAAEAGLKTAEKRSLRLEALAVWCRSASDDDIVTQEENDRLTAMTIGFGLEPHALHVFDEQLVRDVTIAAANGGFLPVVQTPQLIAKRDEIVHLEWPVHLMKEVTIKEYRGTYRRLRAVRGRRKDRYPLDQDRALRPLPQQKNWFSRLSSSRMSLYLIVRGRSRTLLARTSLPSWHRISTVLSIVRPVRRNRLARG